MDQVELNLEPHTVQRPIKYTTGSPTEDLSTLVYNFSEEALLSLLFMSFPIEIKSQD